VSIKNTKELSTPPFTKYVFRGLAIIAWLTATSELHADYNAHHIRTVEWLVDNSDIIVVVVGGDEEKKQKPTKIIRTLKGDANEIVYPLQNSWGSPNWTSWPFVCQGPARVLFIRGKYEILQSIKFVRPIPNPLAERTILHVDRRTYGVTQYGDLLLTETSLLDAIEKRLKEGPSQTLPVHKNIRYRLLGSSTRTIYASDKKGAPKITISVKPPVIVPVSSDFPFETTDETYYLIVPFTAERRDHFIKVLQSKDAAARIHAIRELSYFDDEKAMQAIRDATECDDATPAFQRSWREEIKLLTSADVRAKAKSTLEAIEQD
jgi:hypothetical protein